MKILVFSDSHGNTDNMREALSRNFADTDLVIHLGDGSEDCETVMLDYPRIAVTMISGNREQYLRHFLGRDLALEETLNLDGCKIFATHGHEYNVKLSDFKIISRARSIGADVLLFGHTHSAVCREFHGTDSENALYIMNPGSIGSSSSPSFGIIEISSGAPKLSVIRL